MRSTKTWSPMSSVFSMELEGISKAWRLKVMMNRPVTSTTAMEARNSMGVSLFFSSCPSGFSVFSFLLTVNLPAGDRPAALTYYLQEAVPAGVGKEAQDGARQAFQSTTLTRRPG